MTMEQLLQFGADTLQKAGVLESRLDAWYLLSYCIDINRAAYYIRMHDEVNNLNETKYRELIFRRSRREPLQYITGVQEFMGLEFAVNENVLIPRQDTELLVELVIEHASGKKILDMCTGSGCIAVSLAKMSGALEVDASDISEEALAIAMNNSRANNTNVKMIRSNLWENVTSRYNIVVSNPPYIDDKEMTELMPEVGLHEPELALRGGYDGLDFYKNIVKDAKSHIFERGLLFFEIGCKQGASVSNLLYEYGFENVKIEKDLAGLDRVVWGQLK